jgi:DnaJ-class molecular chaperone
MAKREAEACMPCRGSGRVISNLDGKPHEVTCPWCAGEGVRVPGIDAQAAWLGDGQGAHAAAGGSAHGN